MGRRLRWICGVLLPLAASAQLPAPLPAEMAAVAEKFRDEHSVPGLSVAIAVGGVVTFAQGMGHADLENDVPATAASVYRLASISKPVTAVAVLQLVEQGKLALDAEVRSYLSEWPQKRWPVTARQLLGHLGGVRHYKRREGESTVAYASQRAGLERFAADPLLHEPGTKYRYSTFGYNLAAALVEAGSGRSFADYVATAIASPAGAVTLQDDSVRRLIRHRAQGYVRRAGRLENSELMDSSYKLGGGGLCCNAPDLARFGAALLDGKLISAASLRTMTTRQLTTAGEPTTYGLGWSVGGDPQRQEFWHGGAQARVSTAMLLRPRPRLVVVVMCNLEGLRPLRLARGLADLVEGQ